MNYRGNDGERSPASVLLHDLGRDGRVVGELAGDDEVAQVFASKGRSFAELDLLFEKRISARKFASTSVDVFEDSHIQGTAAFDRYEEKVDAAVRTESVAAGVTKV